MQTEPRPQSGTWPRWPLWLGLVGFMAALAVPLLLGFILGVVAALTGMDIDKDLLKNPAVLIGGTLLQSLCFVGVAVGFAWTVARPRAWQFGLRAARLQRAAGWALLALVLAYGFGILYSVGLGIDEEQTTLKDLGVDQGGLMLVAGAALIIVVAPFCEEFFFRGFLYRSFRTTLGVLPAALGVGAVFGVVHAPTGIDAVPLLIVLGVLLCLAYERSGTLYASIAVHSTNNAVAFAVGTGEWQVGLIMGVVMLAACVALPWLFGRRGPVELAVPPRPDPPAPPVAPVGLTPMDARGRLIAALREHALIVGEVTLASGATAQYYVDAKRATLRPEGFAAMAELVAAEAVRLGATAVGGLTMGADPIASAALAGGAPVKAFFVRKEAKAHGLQRKIEGPLLDATDRCLIVEDVVTSGGSTLEAIQAVTEAGLQIVGVVAVLDRLAGGGDAIREAIGGAPYVALATIDDVYPGRPDR